LYTTTIRKCSVVKAQFKKQLLDHRVGYSDVTFVFKTYPGLYNILDHRVGYSDVTFVFKTYPGLYNILVLVFKQLCFAFVPVICNILGCISIFLLYKCTKTQHTQV